MKSTCPAALPKERENESQGTNHLPTPCPRSEKSHAKRSRLQECRHRIAIGRTRPSYQLPYACPVGLGQVYAIELELVGVRGVPVPVLMGGTGLDVDEPLCSDLLLPLMLVLVLVLVLEAALPLVLSGQRVMVIVVGTPLFWVRVCVS